MSGQVTHNATPKEAHRCDPPMVNLGPTEPTGTVWTCDCRRRWLVTDRFTRGHPHWVHVWFGGWFSRRVWWR